MQYYKRYLLVLATLLSLSSCYKDSDDYPVTHVEINDFVWRGLNTFYLYKDNVTDLSNARFLTTSEYQNYLQGFTSPEDLFNNLIYNPDAIDRFSWITDDYIALEQQFSGESNTHGMEYGLVKMNSSNEVFCYVRYVMPNTDAERKGVKRGDIFNRVNGESLYYNSASDTNIGLLTGDSYTLGYAYYNDKGTAETTDDTLDDLETQVVLTKAVYTENPIYLQKQFVVNGSPVGYLMYNGFTGTNAFDSQLNAAFATFKSWGVTDLILDLRYNPGGSVSTATWLASMITGQFTGEVFVKEQWNSDWQTYFESNNPEALINPFTDIMQKRNTNNTVTFEETINHLNLSRVYIITSRSTASASELIINGLEPYIDVIQVGDVTVGKYQASRTLYDSPTFSKTEVNPTHTYAMQPLIFKSLNANGKTDYYNGLQPDVLIREAYNNLGELGSEDERLLAAALQAISGTARSQQELTATFNLIGSSKDLQPLPNAMYVD